MSSFNFDDLAKKLAGALPSQLKDYHEELTKTFSQILQSALGRLNLVTHDEFEAQRAVLEQAKNEISALEARVKILEEKL